MAGPVQSRFGAGSLSGRFTTHDIEMMQGMSDARVTVSGKMSLLEDGDVADAKQVFLKKNPGEPDLLLLQAMTSVMIAGCIMSGTISDRCCRLFLG